MYKEEYKFKIGDKVRIKSNQEHLAHCPQRWGEEFTVTKVEGPIGENACYYGYDDELIRGNGGTWSEKSLELAETNFENIINSINEFKLCL